ncbi:hypothetical protein [Curtobacterium sp. MMLR14_010]|uniref:hypothetical protein n=1 Tax=Curtobacterium sp. MMLR14_010 TaxID=1898743 RepID=UPI0011133DBC|nr:hypothetical protein [Curtobacterium sp. MMLR14_010]
MTVRRGLDFVGVTEPKSERKNDGTGPDGRWAVPIRRVFPWWYVAGAVVSVGVLILLNPDGNQAMVTFWGPTIGIAIRDREKAARARLDQGLPADRASLLSPRWLEPVCAALLSVFAVGGGLLLDALFGNRTFVTVWVGTALLAGSVLGFLLLLVVLRTRRQRGRTAAP